MFLINANDVSEILLFATETQNEKQIPKKILLIE